jgi:hypothetical protein
MNNILDSFDGAPLKLLLLCYRVQKYIKKTRFYFNKSKIKCCQNISHKVVVASLYIITLTIW